jgi:plastocyanin
MKKVLAIIAVVVVIGAIVGIVVANRKPNNSTASSTSSQSQTKTSSATKPASANSITISNFAFGPAAMTVKAGTTVTWTNQDSVAHTVVETDSLAGPNSQPLDQGKSYSFKFATAGTYHYHCSIHPDMVGTVTVTN